MKAADNGTGLRVIAKGVAIWAVIILAEILHGVARGILLVPLVGEFRSNQIGVFTGSVMILAIAYVFVKWLHASGISALLRMGLMWVALTFAFEVLFGRFVVGLSWDRLLADYSLLAGGLMPVGLIVLVGVSFAGGRTRVACTREPIGANADG